MTLARPDLAKLLLAHKSLVEEVAQKLAHDDTEADDVVQDVWLDALTNPPQHFQSVRGWLATVTTRKVWSRSNKQHRRKEKEELSHFDGVSVSPLEELSRGSVHDEVNYAIDLLGEKPREAISLRYYEGLGLTEIAERLALPVETIRSRLRVGLGQLRQSFSTDGKLDRSRWSLAMAVWVREERVSHGVPGLVGTSAAWSSLLAVGKWLAAAGLVLITTVVGWQMTVGDALGRMAPVLLAEDSATTELALSSRSQEIISARKQLAERPSEGQAQVGALLRVQLIGHSSVPQVKDIKVTLESLKPGGPKLSGASDAQGELQFSKLDPGRYILTTDRGHEQRVVVLAGSDEKLELLTAGQLTVRGKTRSPDDKPVGNVEVWVFPNQEVDHGFLATTSDENGDYIVTGLSDDVSLGARQEGFVSGYPARLTGLPAVAAVPEDRKLELLLGPESRSFEGRVRSMDGAGVPFAHVRGVMSDSIRTPRFGLDGVVYMAPDSPETFADENGRFKLEGVNIGRGTLLEASAPGFVTQIEGVSLRVLDNASLLDFVLEEGSSISGQVFGADGTPRAGARLEAREVRSGFTITTFAGSDGSFLLNGLRACAQELWALDEESAVGEGVWETFDLSAAAELIWNPRMAPGCGLFGEIINSDSEGGLDGLRIEVVSESVESADSGLLMESGRKRRLGVGNRFSFSAVEGQSYSVLLWPMGSASKPLYRWSGLRASGQAVQLDTLASERETASFSGRLIGNAGVNQALELWSQELRTPVPILVDEATGRFEVKALWPGSYKIYGLGENQAGALLKDFMLESGESIEIGELQIPICGGLLLALSGTAEALALARTAVLTIADEGGFPNKLVLARDLSKFEWRSATELYIPGVAPGRHMVSMVGKKTARRHFEVTVQSGRTSRIEVPMEVGQLVSVNLEVPKPIGLDKASRVVFESESGEIVIRRVAFFHLPSRESIRFSIAVRLSEGKWHLRAVAQGSYAESHFEVSPESRSVTVGPDLWNALPESAEWFFPGAQPLMSIYRFEKARRANR